MILNGYKFKAVKPYKDRHGKQRYYYRVTGQPLPDPAVVGFRAFDKAYWDAVGVAKSGGNYAEPMERKPRPQASANDTVEKIVRQFAAHMAELVAKEQLSPFTKTNREQLLNAWARDNGHRRLGQLTKEDVEQGLQNRKATPPLANNWMAAVRALFAYAIAEKLHGIKDDPTQGVKRLPIEKTGGWKAWTEADVEQYFARWSDTQSMEHRALKVLLWSGQRSSDVVTFGWHKFDGDMIIFAQSKTGRNMKLPLAPSLAAILPPRDNVVGFDGKPKPFLLEERRGGRPFTPHWFSEWFGNACRAAGLEGLSAHGTRKLAARRIYRTLLRAGRTDALAMTMAYTGHTSEKQLRVYLGMDFEQEEYAEELVDYMA